MKFHNQVVSAVLLGTVLVTLGCDSKVKLARKPGVIATIGETDILASELQLEINRHKSKGLAIDSDKVLDEIILREILVARARQLGLDRDSETVRAYKNLLIARLKERELEPDLRKAEDSLEEVSKAKNLLGNSRTAAIQQIRFAILRQGISSVASASKLEQTIARITEVRERATQLPPSETGFGTLAIDNSDDQSSRYRGGDLGWMIEDASKLRYDSTMLSTGLCFAITRRNQSSGAGARRLVCGEIAGTTHSAVRILENNQSHPWEYNTKRGYKPGILSNAPLKKEPARK